MFDNSILISSTSSNGINARNIETGDIVWRISAPKNDFFYKVTVVPGEKQGEGKIVAQTLTNMYSYSEYSDTIK